MMKRYLFLAIILMWAMNIAAENPDKFGYFEPRLIVGFGNGDLESTLLDSTFTFDLKNSDLGITIDFLSPVSDKVSLVGNVYFLRSEIDNKNIQVQRLNRFGLQFGLRIYFNPPSGLKAQTR